MTGGGYTRAQLSAMQAAARKRTPVRAYNLAAWQEEDGDVLWWTRPVDEPPYVGTPLDNTWPGHHRWWTPLPPYPTIFTPTRRPADGAGA